MSIRDTPTTYSADEADRIHEMAGQPGVTLECPRCNAPMLVGPPVDRHGTVLQEVCCPQCQRCVMLRDPGS